MAAMRQVGPNELLYNLRQSVKGLPAAVLRDLATGTADRKAHATEAAARHISKMLDRYEVLSSAPLNHGAGDDLFVPAAQWRIKDDG